MKKIKLLMVPLRLATAVILAVANMSASAGTGTYYSKTTATSSGNGKVYVSAYGKNDLHAGTQIAATTHSATMKSAGASQSAKKAAHSYSLYAEGDAGYAFEK